MILEAFWSQINKWGGARLIHLLNLFIFIFNVWPPDDEIFFTIKSSSIGHLSRKMTKKKISTKKSFFFIFSKKQKNYYFFYFFEKLFIL